MDQISWIQEGYSATLWPKVQIPPPGQPAGPADPGLGPDAYLLAWGDRGGPWDVPTEVYSVDQWSHIPNATYHALDGPWGIEFGARQTNLTFETERDPFTEGSVVTEMRLVATAVSDANATVRDKAIDDALQNGTGGRFRMELPGPPRMGHLWNEHGATWQLAGKDLYLVRAGPWTFLVDVNGIDVDRQRGPDHHADLLDRVWADPGELDPDRFPRLSEEPRTIEDAIGWFQTLAAMNEATATDVRAHAPASCDLPPGVGRLPEPG